MPTPFMHLALARRLMDRGVFPPAQRTLIEAGWGAFLLGSIAPDARVSSGIARRDTHFFEYGPMIPIPPAVAMLRKYPALIGKSAHDDMHRAFLAGYLAHLAMDQVWCVELLFPHFVDGFGQHARLLRLFHLLLGHLDDRDRATLPDSYFPALRDAAPHDWLPFIGDGDLAAWRDLVAAQLAPGGVSRTDEILGRVIRLSADEFRTALQSEVPGVWTRITPARLADVEVLMENAVQQAVTDYLG